MARNHTNNKEISALIDRAQNEFGCRIVDNGGTVKIFPPNKNIQPYYAHKVKSAIRPVTCYLRNVCGFMI